MDLAVFWVASRSRVARTLTAMTTGTHSAQQKEALDRQGHIVLPNVLSSDEVRRALECFELRATAARGTKGTRHVTFSDGDFVLPLALRSSVRSVVAQILGDGFQAEPVHGRDPLPGHGLQGLHADAPPRTPGSPFVAATAIWMLDDFTERNGATRIVPGSHLLPGPVPKALAQPGAAHPGQAIVTGACGDVLVFNGHLWHGGTRNDSEQSRRALQGVYHAPGFHFFKPTMD